MSEQTRIQALLDDFQERFKRTATDVFSSPGRIELLGNHTDHNRGKVLVSSVDLNILAAVAPREDNKIEFFSQGYSMMVIDICDTNCYPFEYHTSQALIRGILFKMRELGYRIGGFSCTSDSTIFKGAGVSSSAAFELLIAKIISVYYNNDSIPAFELAKIAQFSESVYFNKPCGLLDQSGIALGGVNYIDFFSTENPEIKGVTPQIDGYQFLIINTGDDHTKLTYCYAAIKDEMHAVAHYFGKEVLRDVDEEEFFKAKDEIIATTSLRAFNRAKHFFEENKRVQKAYDALLKEDFLTFFEMVDQSGQSSYHQLQNCYVKSEDEKLPTALRFVKEVDPSCYCRVHGGGFAGTILVIIKQDKIEKDIPVFEEKFGKANVMKVSLSRFGTYRICHLK